MGGAPENLTAVVGSVKSIIGHQLTGAGSASLIKALLALKHEAAAQRQF